VGSCSRGTARLERLGACSVAASENNVHGTTNPAMLTISMKRYNALTLRPPSVNLSFSRPNFHKSGIPIPVKEDSDRVLDSANGVLTLSALVVQNAYHSKTLYELPNCFLVGSR
jgi:hypothetical protein